MLGCSRAVALNGKDLSVDFFPKIIFLSLFFFFLSFLFFIDDFSTLVFPNPFFYYKQFLFMLLQLLIPACSLAHLFSGFLSTVAIESCVCFHRSLSDSFFLSLSIPFCIQLFLVGIPQIHHLLVYISSKFGLI